MSQSTSCQDMKTLSTTLFSVVLIVAVSGCRPPPMVPVHDISIGAVNPGERYYLVVAGDTLYRIALLHDLEMNTLAHMNKIGPPYGINVGQRLVIAPVPKNVPKPPTTAASPAAAPISTPVAKPAPVPRRAVHRNQRPFRSSHRPQTQPRRRFDRISPWPRRRP